MSERKACLLFSASSPLLSLVREIQEQDDFNLPTLRSCPPYWRGWAGQILRSASLGVAQRKKTRVGYEERGKEQGFVGEGKSGVRRRRRLEPTSQV
jgi:hypothetical protein